MLNNDDIKYYKELSTNGQYSNKTMLLEDIGILVDEVKRYKDAIEKAHGYLNDDVYFRCTDEIKEYLGELIGIKYDEDGGIVSE